MTKEEKQVIRRGINMNVEEMESIDHVTRYETERCK
jgi:hypothetical protein